MELSRPVPEVEPHSVVTPSQYATILDSLTPEAIADMASNASVAINKGLSSGTKEYHIGSRGLTRYDLDQYLKVLNYSRNAAASVSPDGSVSSIQSRRGVPCDV
jgi:hypothetical protein